MIRTIHRKTIRFTYPKKNCLLSLMCPTTTSIVALNKPLKKCRNKLILKCESRLEKACIGHLRIDVDGCGKLWTSWWPHSAAQKYNRPPFRAEFDALINALQRELFRDQAKISGILSGIGIPRMEDGRYYGFNIETDDYRYYFRVYPGKGDYSYCYCYAKEGESDD